MKITIVQREIEEAVRDYINKQIAVQEGMEITMDFTATRGDDGLTAAIDISPAAPAPVAGAAPTRRVQVRTPRPVAVETASEPKAAEPAAEIAVDPAEPVQAEVHVTSQADPVEVESEVDGDVPLKPSIFGNLRRPSSADADTAAA